MTNQNQQNLVNQQNAANLEENKKKIDELIKETKVKIEKMNMLGYDTNIATNRAVNLVVGENAISIISDRFENTDSLCYFDEKLMDKRLKVIGGYGLKYTDEMFSCCIVGTLDLSELNTSSVHSMHNMFSDCDIESLILGDFDTSNVEDMSKMFARCNTSSIDLSSFNTSNVKDMSKMFHSCYIPSIDLSSLNTRNVENMSHMFKFSHIDDIDISGIDMSNVKDINHMFSFSHIEKLNLGDFNIAKAKRLSKTVFSNCNIGRLITSNKRIVNYILRHKDINVKEIEYNGKVIDVKSSRGGSK